MADKLPPGMGVLKVVVVVLGVMIIAMVGLITWAVLRRSGGEPVASPRIELPVGARVVESSLSADRVLLRIALPDGREQLLLVDLSAGRTLSTIELVGR